MFPQWFLVIIWIAWGQKYTSSISSNSGGNMFQLAPPKVYKYLCTVATFKKKNIKNSLKIFSPYTYLSMYILTKLMWGNISLVLHEVMTFENVFGWIKKKDSTATTHLKFAKSRNNSGGCICIAQHQRSELLFNFFFQKVKK